MPDDVLKPSDVIIPPADLTLEETKRINQIIKEIHEKQDKILKNIGSEDIAVYSFLKNEYSKGNINVVFQFVFRKYYGLDNAKLSGEIKSHFFKLLAEKQTNLEIILSELYDIQTSNKKRILFSFATKLLHTIDNNKPIWDSNVEDITNLYPKGSNKDEKIKSRIEIYKSLERIHTGLQKDEKIKKIISDFRLRFKANNESISNTKVLDSIMWSLGDINKYSKIV